MEPRSVLLFDSEQRVSAASPHVEDWLGAPGTPLVGQRCRDVFDCPSCTGDACPLRQALAGEAAEGLLPAGRASGPLAVSSTPISGLDGAGQMALLQLRMQEADPVPLSAGLQPVLDGLRELLESDLAALAFYDDALKEIRWQVTSGSANPAVSGIRLRPGQGFAGRIVLTDLPLRTFRFPEDLTGDPASYPIFLTEGLRSAIGVPVRHGSQVLGVLMVASRREREYSDDDLARLTQVADSLALAAEMMCLHGEAIRAERAKLAEEVHDGLSQNLFGLKLLLSDVAASPEAMQRGLAAICELVDDTLAEVRRLIADLRGRTCVREGLLHLLSDYIRHFYRISRLQVEMAIRLAPGEEVCCANVHEALRIVQEALMNVHRHARATRVWVEVAREGGGHRITIADDGCGFDPTAPSAEGHYGLAIMRERAARLDGRLDIHSRPGEGTIVHLWLPA